MWTVCPTREILISSSIRAQTSSPAGARMLLIDRAEMPMLAAWGGCRGSKTVWPPWWPGAGVWSRPEEWRQMEARPPRSGQGVCLNLGRTKLGSESSCGGGDGVKNEPAKGATAWPGLAWPSLPSKPVHTGPTEHVQRKQWPYKCDIFSHFINL